MSRHKAREHTSANADTAAGTARRSTCPQDSCWYRTDGYGDICSAQAHAPVPSIDLTRQRRGASIENRRAASEQKKTDVCEERAFQCLDLHPPMQMQRRESSRRQPRRRAICSQAVMRKCQMTRFHSNGIRKRSKQRERTGSVLKRSDVFTQSAKRERGRGAGNRRRFHHDVQRMSPPRRAHRVLVLACQHQPPMSCRK